MSSDFIAKISEQSARYQEWCEVMGSNEIPLKSPFPIAASAPGVKAALFYQIDLTQITPEQRERMIKHIARKFDVDIEEVSSTLDTVGCPVLADDVIVVVSHPQRWI